MQEVFKSHLDLTEWETELQIAHTSQVKIRVKNGSKVKNPKGKRYNEFGFDLECFIYKYFLIKKWLLKLIWVLIMSWVSCFANRVYGTILNFDFGAILIYANWDFVIISSLELGINS